ncbi:putative serine/threonine-protein kinase isoform X3 [Capsicum annuum]|uniref:putative serine/threonine-protein kinase isoform X3 n=1 Tax=Capsicum annuum TaxID=4072 RepID=UPI001FB1543F|nr:putative serine/threonine-protein kinase isoform X3 [Capsicum annuum]
MKFSFPFLKCFSSSADTLDGNQIPYDGQISQNFMVYSYNYLKAATQGFKASNKIGEGGFGSVYKGKLQDGNFMAVKVLSVELESMRGEREFVSEIAALSYIKHENLVNLKGCCVDEAHRLLVYDYMENKSLALTFLDFGLARLFSENMSHISTRVAGTLGYLSPEYAISGHLTRKSDVYSFGVVLLEIVSGSPVVAFDITRGEHFLVNKAWEMYNADQLLELVDPVLDRELLNDDEAVRFLKVGLLCVQESASLRPKMSMVIKMLSRDGAIIVDEMKISQPGIVADLRDVKIGRKHSTQSFFSKASTSMSPGSPLQIGKRRKSNS